jgi:hypothetical protein
MAIAIPQRPPHQEPIPQLEPLERLVGEWEVGGQGVAGYVTCEWMVGGYFLVICAEIFHSGYVESGVAYVGYEPETDALRWIWFGENESPLESVVRFDGEVLEIAGIARAVLADNRTIDLEPAV